ncbi:MAG TPA: DNA-formamidopyrimidine glycosylase family protein [Caldimonas sp.]|jgi:formamidopyrimidine-DNA glycosylase|nr:DNA-formamidopyrimidine glycosylase family protein [Caldimonas sp.]HEX2540685.1 DNA-formamidopyrimidine glycosylase family protein [Caldimonas sp.]
MPELPDVEVYVERLAAKVVGRTLQRVRIGHPFLLRSVAPPLSAAEGRVVTGVERLGKRVVIGLEGEIFLVVHLMIAGRLQWLAPGKATARNALAFFEFDGGTLALTEAGKQRRASLHVVGGRDGLRGLDAGGIDPMTSSLAEFAARLRSESHTVKRALTDPRLFSGIGNAYSDEILHRARLSPAVLTGSLDDATVARLYAAMQATLAEWIARLRDEAGDWPAKVTAFHPAMAVHGRFGQPCPDCGAPVQRIVRADNETNYCARCQNGGRLLADRAMSRLLKGDRPKHIDELG